jgi:hypothetical protein
MTVLKPNHAIRVLSHSEELVLLSLARYHYLSSLQICRLHYSPGSLTYVQAKLKTLHEQGFCQRIWLPKRQPHGSAPAIYSLGWRGVKHLREGGVDITARVRPSEKNFLSYLFLTHTLELNDFLIAAELLCRWEPEFQLAGFLHDRDLKSRPVYVRDDDGKRIAVVPDGWLDLRIRGSFQVCLAVELDRGTEEQKKWRRKVASLLAYANGPYQERFNTRSLTFAVVTTAGDRRLLELLKWTKAELEARHEFSQADLFLFTAAQPGAMDSETMFLKPRWYQPFGSGPVALLETADWSG